MMLLLLHSLVYVCNRQLIHTNHIARLLLMRVLIGGLEGALLLTCAVTLWYVWFRFGCMAEFEEKEYPGLWL